MWLIVIVVLGYVFEMEAIIPSSFLFVGVNILFI